MLSRAKNVRIRTVFRSTLSPLFHFKVPQTTPAITPRITRLPLQSILRVTGLVKKDKMKYYIIPLGRHIDSNKLVDYVQVTKDGVLQVARS